MIHPPPLIYINQYTNVWGGVLSDDVKLHFLMCYESFVRRTAQRYVKRRIKRPYEWAERYSCCGGISRSTALCNKIGRHAS